MNNSNPPKLDFQGFSNPTTTPVPDVVFDTLMFFLTDPELRVLLYVIRRTFGFKKTADNISLKQLVEGIKTKDGKVLDLGTGVTKPTVTKAVKGLVEKGVIIAERNRSKERGDEPTTYRLRFREEDPVLTDFTRGGIPYLHGGVKPTLHGGVNALNTQQTVVQETVDNSIVVVMAQLQKFGLSDKVSAAFTENYPAAYLTSKLQQAQDLVDQDRPLKNPAGWLRKAIEENYEPAEPASARKDKKAAAAAEAEQQVASRIRECYLEQSAPEPIGDAGLTTETAWSQTLERLQEKVTGLTYNSWFKDTILLGITEGTAQVMVPSELAAENLRRRHYGGISRILGDVIQQDVELVFIAQ